MTKDFEVMFKGKKTAACWFSHNLHNKMVAETPQIDKGYRILSAAEVVELILNNYETLDFRFFSHYICANTGIYYGLGADGEKQIAIAHNVGPLTNSETFENMKNERRFTLEIVDEDFTALVEGKYGNETYPVYTYQDLCDNISLPSRCVVVLSAAESYSGIDSYGGKDNAPCWRTDLADEAIYRHPFLLAFFGGSAPVNRFFKLIEELSKNFASSDNVDVSVHLPVDDTVYGYQLPSTGGSIGALIGGCEETGHFLRFGDVLEDGILTFIGIKEE